METPTTDRIPFDVTTTPTLQDYAQIAVNAIKAGKRVEVSRDVGLVIRQALTTGEDLILHVPFILVNSGSGIFISYSLWSDQYEEIMDMFCHLAKDSMIQRSQFMVSSMACIQATIALPGYTNLAKNYGSHLSMRLEITGVFPYRRPRQSTT